MYRQENMIRGKILYEKQCVLCKLASGLGFSAFTAFHAWRVSNIWSYFGIREKVFNVFMLGALSSISLMNYYAGYRTYLG